MPRNCCSDVAGISVQIKPELVFGCYRNCCSDTPGIRSYHSKEQDSQQINNVLAAVERFLKKRHYVIHSILISKFDGYKVIQKNRRTNTEEEISSKEIIDLANDIFEFQSYVDGLKFPLIRLIEVKTKK